MIDEKSRQVMDIFSSTSPSSQQLTQITSTSTESSHFDPLLSTDSGNLQALECLLKSTFQKSNNIHDDVIPLPSHISTINDDMSDVKTMIHDLSRTLLAKMTIIESKIDDHCQQTRRINHMLTNTVLPSIIDLTDIIEETSSSNFDGRLRTKLEQIQTRIRATQQSQQHPNDMKDLMDI
jgi:hypothetical protein